MSKYVSGEIVKNGDLERVAKKKAKPVIEETVNRPLALKYKDQNWKIKKKFKQTLRIFKNKTLDELFEDEIWLLFKKMGFKEMNKDRQLIVGVGTHQRQIDVFAKDDNHIILIECKSAEKPTKKKMDLSKDIRSILQSKKEIIDSLKKHYKDYHRYTFFLITKNITLREKNFKLAEESKKKNFFLWTEKETQSYLAMAKQLGGYARVIMYSDLFGNRKVLEPIKVPAIRGGKGDNKYYYFVIQPAKLLSGISYIHRREERNPGEIMHTYQRMLNKTKLMRIREYVQSGGYFANNIIMNFTNKPIFERKGDKIGNIVYGTLTFPKQYGSAWIIDGQHRLLGYSQSGKSEDAYIPVLAFDNMAIKNQAKLFVDINKEQKPISAGLLWDLYSDIYKDSTDQGQQELRAISTIAKKLNSDKDSPLYQLIKLPSQTKDIQKKANLTLTRICIAINENRLIKKKENLLFDESYDKTIDTALEVIKEYLKTISKSFPEDWKNVEEGLLCSNVGIRMLINILRQLLKYLNFYEDKSIYFVKNKNKFNEKTIEILEPVIDKLKSMTPGERSKIRSDTSRESIVENTQKLLWDLKEKTNFGIELWNKGGWTPGVPKKIRDKKMKDLIDETEIQMKSFIIQELKMLFGKDWWEKGIPSGVKDQIKEIKEGDLSIIPWKDIESIPNEEKLRFAYTSNLKDMVIKRSNWRQFERRFIKDRDVVSAAFRFYEILRNKYIHPERIKDLDEIEKGLGYWNMKWLRRCIGLVG